MDRKFTNTLCSRNFLSRFIFAMNILSQYLSVIINFYSFKIDVRIFFLSISKHSLKFCCRRKPEPCTDMCECIKFTKTCKSGSLYLRTWSARIWRLFLLALWMLLLFALGSIIYGLGDAHIFNYLREIAAHF